ncbi:MAG TPA: hypothetical protein PKA58_04720 [Polyangium sp.]|nr:hypothetical protein [Polyangium sp.]
MTVSVYARKVLPDGTTEDLVPAEPRNELAGFESTRQSFYASEHARNLGLTLLPTLAHSNLYLSGDEITRLEWEVRVLLENLDSADSEYWSFRLHNILEAIRLAKTVAEGIGMVCIE